MAGIKKKSNELSATPIRNVGLLAEFANPKTLCDAAQEVRLAGYTKFDAHTPFPIHGLDKAMGLKPSPLGYIVFCGGLLGLTLVTTMQYWMGKVDYPMNISGKPFFTIESSIPIMFEGTVLLSAFTCIGTMLALAKLPKLYSPLFNVKSFERVTDDKFFISIEAGDAQFNEAQTAAFLKKIGAVNVEVVPEFE